MPQPSGRVKTSAAWLIEAAGFGRGFGTPPATLSSKHTLAITNRGGAGSDDLIRLARQVRDGVRDRFGVTLVPEPVLVGGHPRLSACRCSQPSRSPRGDPILGLTEAYLADPNPAKVNLGVGVYQDAGGKLPLLDCVRQAEQRLAEDPKPRGYLPIDGLPGYVKAVRDSSSGPTPRPLPRAGWSPSRPWAEPVR